MRCPLCHRRLLPSAPCPRHGLPAPAATEEQGAPPSLPPGFESTALLGRGGFSWVWAARRVEDGREVALKLARTRGDPRFTREAWALRRLGPPLTPALLGEGVHEGYPFLAMERLQGSTLAWHLASLPGSGALPAKESLSLFLPLCEAVARLHQVGLVHRDLKPENVFLREQGPLALLDLGLARAVDSASEVPAGTEVTRTGEQPGTVLYMAPEQCTGTPPAGPPADVYALGVLLFELLTGRPPFIGNTSEVLQGHTTLRPPRPSELAPGAEPLEAFVLRCLAKEQALRPATAGEALEALRRTLEAPPSPVAREAPVVASAPEPLTRPVALLAVAARAPLPELSAAMAPEGGVLARVHRELYVVAFPDSLSPAAGLKAAARAAVRWGRDRRLLHVAELRVRAGRGGTRLAGAALEQAPSWWAQAPAGEHTWLSPQAAVWLEPGATREGEAGYRLLAEELSATPRPEALPPPPLVGREPLLAELEQHACEALQRAQPTLVVLSGEAGLGKTRMLEALGERLSQRSELQVARLRARQALLDSLLALAPEPLSAEALAQARELPPQVRRQALARLAAEALRQRAARKPLALLVDEAEQADGVVLDALEQATLAESAAPLWACLATRPELLELRPALGDRAGRRVVQALPPLAPEDSHQLLRVLLRPVEYVPLAALSQLEALGRGVPLYLLELVRALQATGAVRRAASGAWELALEAVPALAAGSLFASLAEQALSALPEPLRALARLCAVMGESLSAERLALAMPLLEAEPGLAPLASLDMGVGLQRLTRAGLLRLEPSGLRAFSHPLLREALEAAMPAPLRRRVHRAALATLGGAEDGETLRQRARHAAAAGEREVACEAWLQFAELARQAYLDVEAEQAYSTALELLSLEERARRQRALAGRGRARERSHRYREACEDLSRAAALALARGERAEAAVLLLEQSTALDWLEDWEGASALVQRALEVSQGLQEQGPLAARLALAQGRAEGRRGQWESALWLLEEAARLAERTGEAEVLAIALVVRPVGLVFLGRLEEAEAAFAQALEHCRATGDSFHRAVGYMNRSMLWVTRLELERAVEDLRQAVALGRELGHAQVERFCSFNLGYFLLLLGRAGEAQAPAERARELGQRFVSESSLAADTLLLARLCLERGEVEAARQHVAWVETHALPPPESTPELDLALARRLLAQRGGMAYAEVDWESLLEQARSRSAPFELADMLLEAARCAAEAGAREPLARVLAEAQALVERAPALRPRLQALVALARARGCLADNPLAPPP